MSDTGTPFRRRPAAPRVYGRKASKVTADFARRTSAVSSSTGTATATATSLNKIQSNSTRLEGGERERSDDSDEEESDDEDDQVQSLLRGKRTGNAVISSESISAKLDKVGVTTGVHAGRKDEVTLSRDSWAKSSKLAVDMKDNVEWDESTVIKTKSMNEPSPAKRRRVSGVPAVEASKSAARTSPRKVEPASTTGRSNEKKERSFEHPVASPALQNSSWKHRARSNEAGTSQIQERTAARNNDISEVTLRSSPRKAEVSRRELNTSANGAPSTPPRGKSTSIPSSPSLVKSPAKDLSSVFNQFALTTGRPGASGPMSPGRSGTSKALNIAGRSEAKSRSPAPSRHDSTTHLADHDTRSAASSPSGSRHSSPVRSLAPSVSLPAVLTPSKSASPTKPALRRAATGEVAVLGSRAASTSKKTYGGVRTFKRDIEEERMFGIDVDEIPTAGPSNTSSVAPASASKAKTTVFPSVLRPPRQERRSYAALRSMLGVDQDEDDEESMEPTALKSIAQLRAKGETSKFVDEFSYLVEGLRPDESLDSRRASAVEILRKMVNKDWVRRLKTSGFDERLYRDFRRAQAGQGDRILDVSLALLIANLVRDQRIAEGLCRIPASKFSHGPDPIRSDDIYDEHVSDVLAVLGRVLGRNWAGEELGIDAKSLSKSDGRTLKSICSLINSSGLLTESGLPLSLRSICIFALSIICFYPPRAIFRPQHHICTSGALRAVIKLFTEDVTLLDARINRYEAGLNLLPDDRSVSIESINLCLRIFEATTSATPLAADELCHTYNEVASALAQLVLACHILALAEPTFSAAPRDSGTTKNSPAQEAMDAMLGALRLMVDLTTNDPAWSSALAQAPDLVSTLVKLIVVTRNGDPGTTARFEVLSNQKSDGANEDVTMVGNSTTAETRDVKASEAPQQSLRFDVLCLALGVLTNLVESVDQIKDTLRTTLIDPSCQQSRRCARRCICSGRSSAIHRLTALYLDPLTDSSSELNSSFVHGYTGILLGLVMLDNEENQAFVMQDLAGHLKAKDMLVGAMEEFAQLHEQQAQVEMDNSEFDVQTDGAGLKQAGAADYRIAQRIRALVQNLQR